MSAESLAALFETHAVMSVVAILFVFNLSITVLEISLDLLGGGTRRWGDTLANWALFAANEVLGRTALGALSFVALLPFYYLTPLSIPMTGWSWALALLAADFTYYWMHRIEHKRRILWAYHSVHHSSQDYNLSVGFRLSVVEMLFEWVFMVPMVLIGFNPFQALVALVLIAQYQHWVHTERVGRLGWLDQVFNTPSVHRVHHGSNPQYLDKNFGGVLMLWDKLFGTFEPERAPVAYGLTRNIDTNNPVRITFAEFARLWRDLRKCRSFGDRLRMVFGGLSWRPAYFRPPAGQARPPQVAAGEGQGERAEGDGQNL